MHVPENEIRSKRERTALRRDKKYPANEIKEQKKQRNIAWK
jgi:hypothetical protein